MMDDKDARIAALVNERDDLQEKLAEALRWKAAVDDAGVVHWTLTSETANDPMKAIGALLDVVSRIALDPAVSSDAAKLRDTHLHRVETAERELAYERERREAAEKDTARYRWLRGDAPTYSERWPRWNLQRWDGRCWHSLERGALDAAIDAVMKD